MWGDLAIQTFKDLFNSIPSQYRLIVTLLFFTIVIVVYSVFIFYFYKFIASKNIIDLNLRKYSRSEQAFFMKFFAIILYIVEYLIIFPILTIFWFVIFSVFLLILSKMQDVATILIISAALIAAVRVTSYVNESLSKDLAKMLPFTLLALFLIQPDFFSVVSFFDRINQIPSLITSIPYYILFIILLEFIMRFGELIGSIFVFEKQIKQEIVSTPKINA